MPIQRRALIKRGLLGVLALSSAPILTACSHHHHHRHRVKAPRRYRLSWRRPRVLLLPRRRLGPGVLIVMPDGQQGVIKKFDQQWVTVEVNGKIQNYQFEIEA